jgi:hypothetical protein
MKHVDWKKVEKQMKKDGLSFIDNIKWARMTRLSKKLHKLERYFGVDDWRGNVK